MIMGICSYVQFFTKDMNPLLPHKCPNLGILNPRRLILRCCSTFPSTSASTDLEKLRDIICYGVGSLDELEATLNELKVSCCSSLMTQVLDSSKNEAPARRLLRFFLWSEKHLDARLEDKDYNHAVRVFAEKKDFIALDMLISNLGKQNRSMESSTLSTVANSLVKLGRVDEALGIFKNLDKFRCPQDSTTVIAIIAALCSKGHVKRAEGVIHHHKDKISSAQLKLIVYRNLLHGWSMQENVKESRRVIKDMKGAGIAPDLFCYNTFLKCLCKKNLKTNPSGLVPEALNVMIEMRTYSIAPTTISYNILLSCLGRTRRVKESLQVLSTMRKTGCSPDWVSYYLVARVLYLTGRFGKGKQMVDEMIKDGLVPERKFYYDLIGILCGVERLNYVLELFELMKKSSLGGYETVYNLLIPKLCTNGEFEKGQELWDEATAMGLTLECSSDVLNPLITKVFKPIRKLENKVSVLETPKQKTGGNMKPVLNVQKGKKLFIAKKKGKKLMVHKKIKKERSFNLIGWTWTWTCNCNWAKDRWAIGCVAVGLNVDIWASPERCLQRLIHRFFKIPIDL